MLFVIYVLLTLGLIRLRTHVLNRPAGSGMLPQQSDEKPRMTREKVHAVDANHTYIYAMRVWVRKDQACECHK